MKNISFVALILLSVVGMSTASVLVMNGAPKTSKIKAPQSQSGVEIKWGEGSEAGTPSNALDK